MVKENFDWLIDQIHELADNGNIEEAVSLYQEFYCFEEMISELSKSN